MLCADVIDGRGPPCCVLTLLTTVVPPCCVLTLLTAVGPRRTRMLYTSLNIYIYHISSIKCPGVYFFGSLFTRRLLETALIRGRRLHVCSHAQISRALVLHWTHIALAHMASYARLRLADITRAHQTGRQKTSRAPDREAEVAGSHYMH